MRAPLPARNGADTLAAMGVPLTASLGLGWGLLGVVVLIAWIAGLVDIFRRHDLGSQQRMAWVLIVVLLPIVGTIFYFARR
jgi:hypothetical protein